MSVPVGQNVERIMHETNNDNNNLNNNNNGGDKNNNFHHRSETQTGEMFIHS